MIGLYLSPNQVIGARVARGQRSEPAKNLVPEVVSWRGARKALANRGRQSFHRRGDPLTNPPFCRTTPGRQTASRALLGRANSRIPNILPRLLPITKTPTSLPGL